MRIPALAPLAMLLAGCRLHRAPLVPEPPRGPARDSLFVVDQTRAPLPANVEGRSRPGRSAAPLSSADAILSLLTPDAVYLRAGAPTAYGIAAIRALFAATPKNGDVLMAYEPLGGGISKDLRSGYTYGVAIRTARPGGVIAPERYIAYWERDRGGPWRIAAYAEVESAVIASVADTSDRPVQARRSASKKIEEERLKLLSADSAFADLAYRMGTAYAFANTVAPTGVIFGNPQLAIGPTAVKELVEARGAGSSLSWHPMDARIAASLDLGFTVGDYVSTGQGPTGAAVQRFGKYLTIWKREPDGTWKFVVDGGNPKAAPER